MSILHRSLLAVPFAAVLLSCNSTSSTAPKKTTTGLSGTYAGAFGSTKVSGSFVAKFGSALSGAAVAGAPRIREQGSGGNDGSITITLLNGTTVTLTGSNDSTFTLTDSNGDSCTGTAASVLNATCTLGAYPGVTLTLSGVLQATAGALTTYCGIDTGLLSRSMAGSMLLGIAGSQAFIVNIAAGSNATTFYSGSASAGTLSLTSSGSGSTNSIQGTYTSTTATGTIAGSGTVGVVGAWGAASPCTLVQATLSPTTLAFSAVASGTAPAQQIVVMTPSTVGPVSAAIPSSASWLTATTSGDSVSFAVSTNVSAGSYNATVPIYGQFAKGGSLTVSVSYTVTSQSTNSFAGLFLASSDGQLLGYATSQLGTSNATPTISVGSGAVSGAGYLAVDAAGDLWVSSGFRHDIYEIPTSQFLSKNLTWSYSCELPTPVGGGNVPEPAGIAVDTSGTVWVADSANAGWFYGYSTSNVTSNCALNPTQPSGASHPSNQYHLTSINNSQVPVTAAVLTGMAFDPRGNLWIADQAQGFVYKMLQGQITGSNLELAADAAFNVISEEGDQSPHALAFDAQGNLWVAYLGHGTIAEFAASQLGNAGTTGANYPIPQNILTVTNVTDSVTSIAFDGSGNLWLVESANRNANTGLAFVPASQLSAQNAVLSPTVTFAENGAGPQLPTAIAFSPAPAGLSLGQRVRRRRP